MSEDPIGFGGGHANLNLYIGNSPLNGIDPFGFAPVNPTARAAWLHRRLVEMAAQQAAAEILAMVLGDVDQNVLQQFELGVNQGALNIVEGVTDIGTATVNVAVGDEVIPKSDWAEDLLVDEEDWAHDLSTGIGGTSALILAGAVANGGPRAPTPVRHMDPPRGWPTTPRPSLPPKPPAPAPPSMNAPGLPGLNGGGLPASNPFFPEGPVWVRPAPGGNVIIRPSPQPPPWWPPPGYGG
jgi:hypothetical protein